ncbi:MAG TPA: hypothetical protein VF505_12095 [Thermoanaerobaculia bacterium]|jgi:hypothetical protein
MSCDHVGGPELIEMAEQHLRSNGVPAAAWKGSKFRYTQNLDDSMWASVCVEIERRGDQWIVTRLDRSKESAPAPETGFRVINQ